MKGVPAGIARVSSYIAASLGLVLDVVVPVPAGPFVVPDVVGDAAEEREEDDNHEHG